MQQILNDLNQLLWGYPLSILLLGTHIYFTVHLCFPQRFLGKAIRLSLSPKPSEKEEKSISGFAALSTTLAATLGTGNIIGVSTAIYFGGPGALFWCWMTGVLGMATCYSECFLSMKYRVRKANGELAGGPMYVLKNGLHMKKAASFYAACIVISALGIGSSTQSNAISETVSYTWSLSPWITAFVVCILSGLVLTGGISSISFLTSRLIPVLGLTYLFSCFVILLCRIEYFPAAIKVLFTSAFKSQAILPGVLTGSLQTALRYGIARGLFTNEAGIGTSAICAGSASHTSPKEQSLIQMTAVFWDTVVMCGLTGIVILIGLISAPVTTGSISPGMLTNYAFSILPVFGKDFLAVSLVLFALATIIGWSYIGETAYHYLFPNASAKYYHAGYLFMVFLGAVLPLSLVWSMTDLINGIMIFPNLIALYGLRKEISLDS